MLTPVACRDLSWPPAHQAKVKWTDRRVRGPLKGLSRPLQNARGCLLAMPPVF